MKEILMIVGIIFGYLLIGEFIFGLCDDYEVGDIIGEIVMVAGWPVWIMLAISLWFVFKIIDPIIGKPFLFAKKIGRKLGKNLWKK